MRLVVLLACALPAFAQEQAVQRALIERDQQSAQFAARLRGAPLVEQQRLENVAAQQLLHVEKDLPQALRPYERQQAASEHTFAPPPAARRNGDEKPRPLPVAPPCAVNVVPPAEPEARSGLDSGPGCPRS